MIIWIYHHRIYKLFFLSSQKSVISVTVFSWRTFAQCRVNSYTLILKCANIDLMDRKWKRGVDENLKLWQKLSVCEIVEHGKLCGCRCRQEVEPKRRWAGTDNRGGTVGMEGAFLRGKTPFLDDNNYFWRKVIAGLRNGIAYKFIAGSFAIKKISLRNY